MRELTITILQGLYFHTTTSIATRILGMFSYILPREVCTEPVDLTAVMPDEENEVFCSYESCAAACCKGACLKDLETEYV